MSLITSCPACGTMFRVVPDQLRISEGWVRCGHCAEVFDAAAHLATHEAPRPQEPSLTEPGDLATQPPDWDAFPDEPQAPAAPPRRAAWVEEPEHEASGAFPLPSIPSSDTAIWRESQDLEPPARGPDSRPASLRAPDPRTGEQRAAGRVAVPVRATRESAALATAAHDAPEPDLDDVSFVRQARRTAFWRRPGVRFSLVLLSLVLLATLALQAAWFDHDRLAAAHRPLRPVLDRVCEVLQCQIEPPRQIEAIVIENSGFTKVRGDVYRLSFTLRNTSASEVAAPAMELTLTDTQDQPVLRRVLTPAEMGATSGALAGASDWSGVAGLTVSSTAAAGRIAGYRLLAFYP
jgi:predicted Zn finger-like uncharacterized protein